jgi:ABC-type branched-subunit amino acid transport system ATPase component
MAARLEVVHVTHRFRGLTALRDVSLTVEPGTLVVLVGPNGAGKTTLLDVLSGRLRPTLGAARFDGADLTRLAPHRIAALGVGRTFQIARPFAALPAVDNVRVGIAFAARGPASREPRGRAHALLERVGLAGRGAVPAGRLSLGEQKRLELAMALGGAPRLLLLDEPAGGLPPAGRAEIHALCASLRDEGLAVLAIEHGPARLARLADRVVVLDGGVIRAAGAAEAVLGSPRLAEAYLGEDDAWSDG